MKKFISESLAEFVSNLSESEIIKGGVEPIVSFDDVDKKEFLLGLAIEKKHSKNLAVRKQLVLQNLSKNSKFYSEGVKDGLFSDAEDLNAYKKYFIDKKNKDENEPD